MFYILILAFAYFFYPSPLSASHTTPQTHEHARFVSTTIYRFTESPHTLPNVFNVPKEVLAFQLASLTQSIERLTLMHTQRSVLTSLLYRIITHKTQAQNLL